MIPATVGLLAALFAVQRLGTGRLGFAFGWVMLAWFVVIGAMGLWWVIQCPRVLLAFNPLLALETLHRAGWSAAFLMGGVVLAVTGVEALYADMGHFSRRAISWAWHGVALPGLLLNYLGQAALAVKNPALFARGTHFFDLVPDGWMTLALVGLATAGDGNRVAGALFGRFLAYRAGAGASLFSAPANHSYEPAGARAGLCAGGELLLGAACVLLVVTFRSSANLAAAYGLAVVGTMLITTLAIGLVAQRCWAWPVWKAARSSWCCFGGGAVSRLESYETRPGRVFSGARGGRLFT